MANILEFLWYKNTAYQIPLQSYPLYQNYLGWMINWLINFMDRGLPWTIQSIGIVFRICKTLLFIIIWQVHQWFQDIFFNDPSFGVKRSDFGEFASHECDYCFWMIHYRWKLSSTLSLLPLQCIGNTKYCNNKLTKLGRCDRETIEWANNSNDSMLGLQGG